MTNVAEMGCDTDKLLLILGYASPHSHGKKKTIRGKIREEKNQTEKSQASATLHITHFDYIYKCSVSSLWQDPTLPS